MHFEQFYLGAVVSLVLAVLMAGATSLETNNNLQDIRTKLDELTEQMLKISGQLSEVYEQQQEHSGQLSKLSEEQTKLSAQQLRQSDQLNKLTNEVTELTNQHTDTMSRNTPDDGAQIIGLISQIKELEKKMYASSSGPVFVRWGRKTCNGTGSETVYTGVAGGSPDADAGGGADLLCLPRDPSYANHNNDDDTGSHILVAEYKLDSSSNFPFEDNDPLLHDEDVPCAVCQVTNGSSVMMIPARVDCYSGWRLEYRGYLMTEQLSSHRIQYVCVDESPEIDYGGGGSAPDSVHLYVVEANCYYLPCPPFEEFAETACVVCSK